MHPPLFRKATTSELTAKTKGSDRIFTTKLGLSQPLMIQEGTHNPNVTLKGHPKKFWGMFGQKTHKTQQIILFHTKRGCLSLILMNKGQTFNPKCKPKQLPTKTQRFSWYGHVYSTCNTENFPDWLNSQN